MKAVRVVFSPEAEAVYQRLTLTSTAKTEQTILHALEKKIEIIKHNCHYGDPLAKALIPSGYVTTYGVTNLFRIPLPNFWRMLYTLTDGEDQNEIIAFVLDLIDHKTYDKKFGYKKK